MPIRPFVLLASVVLLSVSVPVWVQAQTIQAQGTPVSKVQCLLAERTDLETFSLLVNFDPNEAGQDQAAYRYAECQAAGLSRILAGKPQLAARIVTLRRLYRELAALDGKLAHSLDAGQDASSDTIAIHASNRSVVGVEPTLRTLAALASATAAGYRPLASSEQIDEVLSSGRE